MKTKLFFLIFVLSLSIQLFGQDFGFNQISSPSSTSLYSVKLFSNNESLISGYNADFYYDGNSVSVLSNTYNGDYFSAIEDNSGIYALALREEYYIYKWDDVDKVWNYIDIHPPVVSSDAQLFVISRGKTLLLAPEKDSLKIWKFDETNFILLKTILNPERKWGWGYGDDYFFPRSNDALIVIFNYADNLGKILSYNYTNDSIAEIDNFPFSIWNGCTFDNQNFFFSSGREKDSLVKWNLITLEKELICSNITGFYNTSFMISNNDIILAGSDGIVSFKVSTRQMTNLNSSCYTSSSYCPQLQKAFFVGYYSLITEMTIANKVHETEAYEAGLKLYPIPAQNKLNIDFPVLGINEKKIEVYNNLGQLVGSKVFSEFTSEIDISGLEPGIYFVRLSDEETGKLLSSKKFIKQ